MWNWDKMGKKENSKLTTVTVEPATVTVEPATVTVTVAASAQAPVSIPDDPEAEDPAAVAETSAETTPETPATPLADPEATAETVTKWVEVEVP